MKTVVVARCWLWQCSLPTNGTAECVVRPNWCRDAFFAGRANVAAVDCAVDSRAAWSARAAEEDGGGCTACPGACGCSATPATRCWWQEEEEEIEILLEGVCQCTFLAFFKTLCTGRDKHESYFRGQVGPSIGRGEGTSGWSRALVPWTRALQHAETLNCTSEGCTQLGSYHGNHAPVHLLVTCAVLSSAHKCDFQYMHVVVGRAGRGRRRCVHRGSGVQGFRARWSLLCVLPLWLCVQQRRQGGINPYAAMLMMQLFQQVQRLEYRPPATLVLMGVQVALHYLDTSPWFSSLSEVPCGSVSLPRRRSCHSFSVTFVHIAAAAGDVVARLLLSTEGELLQLLQVCLNPAAIVQGRRTLARLLLSGFLHGDDIHLYYNMVSLLWKGAQLERRMGTQRFIVMVAFLLVSSHILVVASAFFAADMFGYPSLIHQCAVRRDMWTDTVAVGPAVHYNACGAVAVAPSFELCRRRVAVVR